MFIIRPRCVLGTVVRPKDWQVRPIKKHLAHEIDTVHVAVRLALVDGIMRMQREQIVLEPSRERALPLIELIVKLLKF